MKAMILAAGLGTRLRPYTNTTPKALLKVGDKTMLQIVSEKLIDAGVSDIVINVHHHAAQMISAINELKYPGIRFHISDETDLLLDTGGGIKKARHLLDGNQAFLAYNIDILCNIDLKMMLKTHTSSGALATLAVSNRMASRYFLWKEGLLCGWQHADNGETILCHKKGVVVRNMHSRQHEDITKSHTGSSPEDHPATMNSEKQPETIQFQHHATTFVRKAFSGIHILEPAIVDLIDETGVFSIKDVYLRLAGNHPITCFEHDHKTWIDIGTPDKLARAREHFDTG
jgi:N-acetyl-alpha-D-muramate 1-phosphate uridylyltransferase